MTFAVQRVQNRLTRHMTGDADMQRFSQEFFWTPAELIGWLRDVATSMRLWIVLWPIGEDARLIEAADLQPEMFDRLTEDSVQLFVGSADLSGGPAWRNVNGRRLVDFPLSHAVQLVPSLFALNRNVLLQGRLAILRPDQYEDVGRAKELVKLFRRLQSGMKRASNEHVVVVQSLPSGEKKEWRNMLVGKSLAGLNIELKQFAHGAAKFAVENT